MTQAGFIIQAVDPHGFLCASDLPMWKTSSQLYVRLVLEVELDLDLFQELLKSAQAVYKTNDLHDHMAVVVIDRPPRASDLYQIFALRAQKGLTIVLLPSSLMYKARLDGQEQVVLDDRVKLYNGREDLYGTAHFAVSDILSFFGRSALLADLQRRLMNGHSISIFGMRKIGKSSLMHRLREEGNWPVAFIDLQGYIGDLPYVYSKALSGWRDALKAKFPNMPSPDLPDPRSGTTPAEKAQAFREGVGHLFEVLVRQHERLGLLLFLDEADLLLDQSDYWEFASVLRSIAEDVRWRGRFAILTAGLDPELNRRDRIHDKRNPFFNFFSEAPLGLFDQKDIETMIVSLGGQMGIKYETEALARLTEVAGGHPFLTRQLCSWAIRGLERQDTVNVQHVSYAENEYLRFVDNYLAESLWDHRNGGPPQAEATLLTALAAQQPLLEATLILENSPTQKRAARLALQRLRDQSLIARSEADWEISIPLYRRWIRHEILGLLDEG